MDIVLFGAGASTFSCTCSAPRPPLGEMLFQKLWQVFPQVADTLNPSARLAFTTGRPFEEAMHAALPAGSPVLAPFLRYLAMYLSEFEPCVCPENAYRRMVWALRKRYARTLFASLNYDLLFERVVYRLPVNGLYGDAVSHRTVGLLKPHGSCNWLPMLDGNVLNNVGLVACEAGLVDGLRLVRPLSSAAIASWCLNPANGSLAPAMSVYAVGKKTPFNPFSVEEQRNIWATRVLFARRIVIIGVRYIALDSHIWNPIAASRAAITYINPNRHDVQDVRRWRREAHAGASTEYIEKGFIEALPSILARLLS